MNSVLNPVMTSAKSQIKSQIKTQTATGKTIEPIAEVTKYITFKLTDYLFALPSEKILKVVATPSPQQGGLISLGLVQLEQYSIQILDLPQLLALDTVQGIGTVATGSKAIESVPVSKSASASSSLAKLKGLNKATSKAEALPSKNPPFLMVLQNADQDLLGIAVHEPPDLMDIPDYALKPVPAEKRLSRTLKWVSHVVTYDLGRDRHTLLLLDLSVLLMPQHSQDS